MLVDPARNVHESAQQNARQRRHTSGNKNQNQLINDTCYTMFLSGQFVGRTGQLCLTETNG